MEESLKPQALIIHQHCLIRPILEGMVSCGIECHSLTVDEFEVGERFILEDGSKYDFVFCGCDITDEKTFQRLMHVVSICAKMSIGCFVAISDQNAQRIRMLTKTLARYEFHSIDDFDINLLFGGNPKDPNIWVKIIQRIEFLELVSVASKKYRQTHKEENGQEFHNGFSTLSKGSPEPGIRRHRVAYYELARPERKPPIDDDFEETEDDSLATRSSKPNKISKSRQSKEEDLEEIEEAYLARKGDKPNKNHRSSHLKEKIYYPKKRGLRPSTIDLLRRPKPSSIVMGRVEFIPPQIREQIVSFE